MNIAFFKFRIRQLVGFIKEVPVPYMIILLIMLGSALIAIYFFMENKTEGVIVGGCLLLLLLIIHLRRKDYHFICLVETSPWQVFGMDYLLVAFPFILIGIWQKAWLVTLGIIAGCMLISFIKQPFSATSKGFSVPRFIPWELFEIRTGFRSYGGWSVFLLIGALAGLLFPYASFGFLWFYTLTISDSFRVCESKAILCSRELPAGSFLWRKIRINTGCYMISILPVCFLYILIRPVEWWLASVFFLLASLNVLLYILYKYAVYEPGKRITSGQISLILSALGILIPVFIPFTFLLLIRYYIMARTNLNPYLYAYN